MVDISETFFFNKTFSSCFCFTRTSWRRRQADLWRALLPQAAPDSRAPPEAVPRNLSFGDLYYNPRRRITNEPMPRMAAVTALFPAFPLPLKLSVFGSAGETVEPHAHRPPSASPGFSPQPRQWLKAPRNHCSVLNVPNVPPKWVFYNEMSEETQVNESSSQR